MEETTESPFIRIRTGARRPFTKLTKGERKKKKTEPFQSLSPARVNFVFCHIQLFFFFSLFFIRQHTRTYLLDRWFAVSTEASATQQGKKAEISAVFLQLLCT